MTETERITNAVYERHQRPPLHRCHTSGCLNIVAGDDYCARCAEEIDGQPYPFAEHPQRDAQVGALAVLDRRPRHPRRQRRRRPVGAPLPAETLKQAARIAGAENSTSLLPLTFLRRMEK